MIEIIVLLKDTVLSKCNLFSCLFVAKFECGAPPTVLLVICTSTTESKTRNKHDINTSSSVMEKVALWANETMWIFTNILDLMSAATDENQIASNMFATF